MLTNRNLDEMLANLEAVRANDALSLFEVVLSFRALIIAHILHLSHDVSGFLLVILLSDPGPLLRRNDLFNVDRNQVNLND